MTNSIVEFLDRLSNLNIKLEADGDRLRSHAPEGMLTPTLLQEITRQKTEIMLFLQQAKQVKTAHQLSIQRVPRDGELPLSFAQQRLWFLHQLLPDSRSYNMLLILRLEGSLNIVALQQSLSELVRRHEVLRTTFPTVDGKPVQVIAPPTDLTLPVYDLQGLSAEEQTDRVRQMAESVASNTFDLAVGPLVQLTLLQLNNHEYVLLLKMHHIIYDGWSLDIFNRELSHLYTAFTQGLPNPLPELPIQYADFAVWQRQWLTGEVLERQLTYWQKQLAGVLGVLELPTDKPRPPVQTFRGGVERFQLDRDLTQRLKQLSQKSDATLFMTLLAAFLVLLSRYSGQLDIVVGSPIANRNNKSIKHLMGFFANTLALRGDLSGNPSFADFLAQVRQTTLSAYDHQDLPFEMLVERLQPERDLSRNPLVQVMFALQNVSLSFGDLPDLTIENISLPVDEMVKFDLDVGYWEVSGGLEGVWSYSADLFDATTITRIAQHFQTLLQAIVTNQEVGIAELPLMTVCDRHRLLVEWNNTQVDYSKYKCIHQLFEEQVERTPDAVAVVFENQQLTYQQLNTHANQLAHYLKSLGVGANVLVGICVERSLEMIVGILAILKAGGAYVPLDPAYPDERLAFMLQDAAVKVLLTQAQFVKGLSAHSAQVVCFDKDWKVIYQQSQENLTQDIKADNLAYVIYTSGSTGKPKGVLLEHQGLCNLATTQQNLFHVQSESRILQFASFGFDVSVSEIFMALTAGATLILATRNALMPVQSLLQILHEQAITHVTLPPSALAALPPADLPMLQTMIVAGEACSANVVASWASERQFFNAYGPTEATVYATVSQCSIGDQKPPIGRPIANTQVYLLDEKLQPAPIGLPGELYIGGVGLARGYLNLPDLTTEKFISNPFSNEPGDRLYKTGDLARYLPDGNIEFLGRIDHQVKIRGFRIELEEIEAVLSQYSTVQQAVVVVREEVPGDKRLVAYYVSRPEIFSSRELRAFLKQRLPNYMVPADFVLMEALPLTPNGKVDRRALPAPDRTRNQPENHFVAPSTPTEVSIAKIWTQVLGLQQVGIHDNFFELGGHSLSAVQIVSRIRETFEIDLPLSCLFEAPMIAALSQAITSARETQTLERAKTPPAIVPVPRTVSIPLSFSQYEIWYLEHETAGVCAGNSPLVLQLTGTLSPEVLKQSFNEIIRRHEILRTTFSTVEEQTIQKISPFLTIPLEVIDLQHLPLQTREIEAQKILRQVMSHRFNLTIAPLIKTVLVQLSPEEHCLLILMHHIITDGWSYNVLLEELTTLYEAFLAGKPSPLPDLPFQYADFAIWQRNYFNEEVLATHLPYWQQHLASLPTSLDLLPATETSQDSSGALTYHVALPQDLTNAIASLGQSHGVTPFMVLLTALNILLWKWSDQTDILVLGTMANRPIPDLEKLIGCFISDLPLRTQLDLNQTGSSLLEQVKQMVSATLTHAIPVEKLWEPIWGNNIEVLRTVNLVLVPSMQWPSQTLRYHPLSVTSYREVWNEQFIPLELYVSYPHEKTQPIELFAWYSTKTFTAETIDYFISSYQAILQKLVEQPERQLFEI